ncbi:MAG TPA: LysR family transcriptional regulator [Pirellulales bacterium]|jgi:DNA-binding transcriptional LysR family regulator|nr:LysR family transcriptional regulator [Pirellulales bacterium]
MAVQLKALKIFCDVVRQRSFSRAADENDISQSGASQVVHQLEEGLGVKLIDRSKRPFVLTPEGEEYYDGCRAVVERYYALEDRVRTLHQEVVGRVRVASIYSVGLHHMDRYVQEFLAQHPKANVRLEYLHPDRVYQSVEDDVADIGLISYPKPSRTLQAIQWREEPMVLVTAPRHRLAGREQIGLRELHGEKMIGFDRDLTIRNEIDRVLNLHRIEVRVIMEFDNIETIKRAIEIEAGIALLPEPTVLREVQAGTLSAIALDTDELVRPLGIIHRRGRDLSSTAERFIELLKREGQKIDAVETPVSTTLVRAVEGNAAKVDPLRNGGDGRSHGHSHGASSYMDSQQETDQEGNGRPSATESPRAARAASV